jgi:hypothetical protein
VRAIYADWERGDFSRAWWADPEIEFTTDTLGVFALSTWKGLAGMAEGARAQLELFENQRIQAEEYRELDDRRVLVLDLRSGRGKHSGIEFGGSGSALGVAVQRLHRGGAPGAHLFEIDGGKVARLLAYFDRDRALADLGLET